MNLNEVPIYLGLARTDFSSKEYVHHTVKKIQPRFIKSDLENINDLIIQELPQDSLIHLIDNDYVEPNCVSRNGFYTQKIQLVNDEDIYVDLELVCI